jgi:hypothetical protein
MVNEVSNQKKLLNQGSALLEAKLTARGNGTPRQEPTGIRDDTIPRWNFPEWFIIAQTLLPAMLLIPGIQAIRTPIRVAPYAISLLGLLWWWNSKRNPRAGAHPASPWLLIALIFLGCQILHPRTNSLLAGTAQVVLYLSVLAPVLWMPRLVDGHRHLGRLLILFFICNGINSCVGILQVYNPDVWMPKEFSRTFMANRFGLDAVSYIGPDGRRIVRPPGLFDSPGAVCGPAMVTALLGLIFCLGPISIWKKMLASLLGLAGMAAIYLSQVRSSFLVVAVMVLASVCVLMFFQREQFKATLLLGLYGSLLFAAFSFAVGLGGQSVSERFASLIEEDPFELFYKSRGQHLEYGFKNYLADYPSGAGLGRWGMVNLYFGDPYNIQSQTIWAEEQLTAWILDGGWVMLILYGSALLASTLRDFRLTVWGPPELRFWALAVLAANVGTMALILSYTPFTGQIGMQYWLLTGALQGAAAVKGAARIEGREARKNDLQWVGFSR